MISWKARRFSKFNRNILIFKYYKRVENAATTCTSVSRYEASFIFAQKSAKSAARLIENKLFMADFENFFGIVSISWQQMI